MQSRVQRLSHMLFHQLFPQQLDRRQLKNSSDPRLRLKFWYFFHNMEGPGFTGGARCRNAYSLSAARRVNREIVRSVSQQQVHKCGRILSGEKNHLSREKYLASHRVTPMCAILKQFWQQHIFQFPTTGHLTFPHALQRRKCDRACQSKSSIHTHAAASGIARTPYRGLPQGYSWKRPPISPSCAHLLNHSSLKMHKTFKGNNGVFLLR